MDSIRTIILAQIGLASFGVVISMEVAGEKGNYSYMLGWNANALTFEWHGVIWSSR